jgi:cytoskeletal protein CcmA (bactofilin family)
MIWRKDEASGDPGAPAPHQRPFGGQTERADQDRTRERRNMAGEEREVTIVGQGASLEGSIVASGSMRVDGKVKGQINADGDVILSPQSQVDADITAENVTVAGKFKGSITVKGTAELTRGGRVDGNVTSKTLIVQEGGIFQGQSIMDQQAAQAAQAPAGQAQQAKAAASPATSETAQPAQKEQPREKTKASS